MPGFHAVLATVLCARNLRVNPSPCWQAPAHDDLVTRMATTTLADLPVGPESANTVTIITEHCNGLKHQVPTQNPNDNFRLRSFATPFKPVRDELRQSGRRQPVEVQYEASPGRTSADTSYQANDHAKEPREVGDERNASTMNPTKGASQDIEDLAQGTVAASGQEAIESFHDQAEAMIARTPNQKRPASPDTSPSSWSRLGTWGDYPGHHLSDSKLKVPRLGPALGFESESDVDHHTSVDLFLTIFRGMPTANAEG